MQTCYQIDREIQRFQQLTMQTSTLKQEAIDEFGWLLRPQSGGLDIAAMTGGKSIGLTLMGITHGNEWAGLAVLNHLGDLISSGALQIKFPLALLLGNPWAARENRRFLDNDLNRSFASKEVGTREQKRAQTLMTVLGRSARLIDFHQTSRSCDRAFFIFPYGRESFSFARSFAPEQTIVTHWGSPFSIEGQCTDEYVNDQGGVGISLELGQNGFDPYQIAAGVHAGVRAIAALNATFAGSAAAHLQRETGPILTFGNVMEWPASGVVTLVPGLDNFRPVEKDEVLGHIGDEPILAPQKGLIMFAKYLTEKEQASLKTRPTELCRILVEISADDLPADI